MKILIADDDRLSAYILESTLKASGYEVIVTTDGAQAWKILQSEDPPRLAILDWMMPGLDGLEVCRRVRSARGPYIYILLLTANIGAEEVVAGINAGADDYIKKPFNQEELHARLRTGIRILTLEEKLRLQATRDSLTQLSNRGAIMEALDIELQRAHRENRDLSVAMIDIDHFKRVNDTFGHVAGDAVICAIAGKMRAMLRPYDLIGRYGGEEFIVVFPNCDTSQAASISERLRCSVSDQDIDAGVGGIPVTVSIGVADTRLFKDSDSLIAAADAALYRGKRRGRNRVETADSPLTKMAMANLSH